MVKVRYTGLGDPKGAFDALRPFRDELVRMSGRYFPFGPEYLVILQVKQALDRAAAHFTGDPTFYGGKIKPEPGPTERVLEPRDNEGAADGAAKPDVGSG